MKTGTLFGIISKLEVEQDGQKFEWNEVANIYEGKLVIGEKDDPYAKYRDGKMNFEIEKLKEKLILIFLIKLS